MYVVLVYIRRRFIVQADVHQGSVIRPLLFNIFINVLYDLLMTMKSIEQLVHLVIIYLYSQLLIEYISGLQ